MAEIAIYPFGRVGSLSNVYRFPRSSIADDVANSRLFEQAASGINGLASGTIALAGTSEGVVRIVGAAAGTIALTGTGTGGVLVQGAGSTTFALTGEATGAVVVQGAASGSLSLIGTADGRVYVSGSASGSFGLSGSATGSLAAASITGAASGSISFTGYASGVVISYVLRPARTGRGGATINRKTQGTATVRRGVSRNVGRRATGRR